MAVLSKPLLAQCHTCKRPIFWVVTENGKKMPVDTPATADGNIIFINRLAHVLKKDEVVPEGEKRWTSHYATCPQAEQHRKTKGKKEPVLTLHLNMETMPGFDPQSMKFGISPEMEVEIGYAVTLHCGPLVKAGVVSLLDVDPAGEYTIVTVDFERAKS